MDLEHIYASESSAYPFKVGLVTMPVTVKPSPELVGRNADNTVPSVHQILQSTYSRWYESVEGTEIVSPNRGSYPGHSVILGEKYPLNLPIIQSSFGDLGGSAVIAPYGNGFVDGILRAFLLSLSCRNILDNHK